MVPLRDAILAALANVIDPELRKPVTELDMVRGVAISGGDVTVTIALTVAGCPLRNSFQEQVAREVGGRRGRHVGAARVRRDEPRRARRADDEAPRRAARPTTSRSSSTRPPA